MSNHTEIRWHGRGGQGAKTAALLLADVAFQTGKYVQGFPLLSLPTGVVVVSAYIGVAEERWMPVFM